MMINNIDWIASDYNMTGDQLFYILSNAWTVNSPEWKLKQDAHSTLTAK